LIERANGQAYREQHDDCHHDDAHQIDAQKVIEQHIGRRHAGPALILGGFHVQPTAVGQAQLKGKLPGSGAGTEQGIYPGPVPLAVEQGEVKQVQGRARRGFFINQAAQQRFGGLVLKGQRVALHIGGVAQFEVEGRGAEVVQKKLDVLRIAAGNPHDIGQAAGNQARGDFQHLTVAHVIPDAAGQHLGGEHARDQDHHQPTVEGTRQQRHDSLVTQAEVSI